MTLLAFALPFLLFISFPSRMWNFDGVACAAALELGNPMFLFHSNHLLYGFFGFLFWKPLSFGILPRALPALQLFTSLLSAAGLAGLFMILQSILTDRRLALLATLCVSVTAVVWVWSIEAQVYALGFLALSWATYHVMRPAHPKKWLWVGALHAGAVLGHIIHALWIVPALYLLWKENPRVRTTSLRRYLLVLAAGTALPYLLVIGTVILPKHLQDGWLVKWLLGSAALNAHSTFQWHFAGWTGPLDWATTSVRLFWGSFWPYQTNVPLWCGLLTLVSISVVLGLLGMSLKRKNQPLWTFCALWLAVYGVFFWTWEPATECYRLTDFIPLGILLGLGAHGIRQTSVRWVLLALLFMTLVPVNLRTRIIPMHDPQKNVGYRETQALARATPDNSLYLTLGGIAWIYLLYFSGRSAWNVNSLMRDPDRLGDDIARRGPTQPVFIQAQALGADAVKPWIARYKRRPVEGAPPWLQLQ